MPANSMVGLESDGVPWWCLPFIALSALLAALAVSVTMFERSFRATEFGVVGGSAEPSALDVDAYEPADVGRTGLFPVGRVLRYRVGLWRSLSTKLFMAIVLSCTCLYVSTALPFINPPFWWTACLHLFVYPAAYLFYRVIRLEE